jgi:hypothetical protein
VTSGPHAVGSGGCQIAGYAGYDAALYESGPAVKLGTSHCFNQGQDLTDPRIVDGIEQRSSLYGLLSEEGQGWVGGCSGGPIR